MTKSMSKAALYLSALLMVTLGSHATVSAKKRSKRVSGAAYEVVLTNLTRGQLITAPVVVSHRLDYRAFEAGGSASPGLIQLAEEGETATLVTDLNAHDDVNQVSVATGPLAPGKSVTIPIRARPLRHGLSVYAKLATTNDAFVSLQGKPFLQRPGAAAFGWVWDAGSEANSEDCAHIPGPPCNKPRVRLTAGAEGFIHMHSGVHGGKSLQPASFDWRGPALRVELRLKKK